MPPVLLVASDIDGTLLGPDRVVGQRTTAVLRRMSAEGVTVVAATGRSHWSALPLLEPVGCIRWAICSNGATLYDFEADDIVHRQALAVEVAVEVVETISRVFPTVGYSWETEGGIYEDERFTANRERTNPDMHRRANRRQTLDPTTTEVVKLMVAHDELTEMEWLDSLRPHLPEEVNISTSGAAFVEVTAPEADKGHALAALCDRIGVRRESTIAFGDHSNDMGMLGWAGRGYAMANAHPRVLDAASHTAPHHADEGVAQVLESLLDP